MLALCKLPSSSYSGSTKAGWALVLVNTSAGLGRPALTSACLPGMLLHAIRVLHEMHSNCPEISTFPDISHTELGSNPCLALSSYPTAHADTKHTENLVQGFLFTVMSLPFTACLKMVLFSITSSWSWLSSQYKTAIYPCLYSYIACGFAMQLQWNCFLILWHSCGIADSRHP